MDKQRVKEEFSDFMALPAKEKWDRVVNGERQLGRLYQKGSIAFTRREWKGVESTARDFQNWLILWARHDKDGHARPDEHSPRPL